MKARQRPQGQNHPNEKPGQNIPASKQQKVGAGQYNGKVATPAGARVPKAQRHPSNRSHHVY